MTLYKNFEIDSQNEVLTGYEWNISDPKAVCCLIHGIGEHAGRYDHVGKSFNDAGIALVSMDLRGHGRSPGKRGHIGDRIIVRKDIDNLIEYIKRKYPGIPLILYGHSLGGNISLEYRLRGEHSAEMTGYLITSPWIKLVRQIPSILQHVIEVGDKMIPTAVISQKIDNKMLGNMDHIKKEEDSDLRHQNISIHTALEGFSVAEEIMNNSILDKYGGGEKPVLLMHGTDDPVCDIEGSRAVAGIYGEICEFIEWEDYLHELHNGTDDKPGEPVIEKMIDWVLKTANSN